MSRAKGVLAVSALIFAAWAFAQMSPWRVTEPREQVRRQPLEQSSPSVKTETYRLVQSIGNEERETARNLSKADCERQKNELQAVGEAVGAYNERLGRGAITCLPESFFAD
jgi:hypothetical protein